MRKTYFLITFLLLSLLLVNCVQAASPDDFSEFDEFDEPQIKIESPELNEVDHSPKQPPPEDHEFDEEHREPAESRGDASNGHEDEEVTVEEEVQPEEDELPEKKEKEKKPFEPIKLSSLPLHLRSVNT